MSDTRTIQERLRDEDAMVAQGLFHCVPVMRQAADRIDALEKALAMARPYVDAEWPLDDDDSEEAKDARAASEEIERLLDSSALHPSDNDAQVAGPMK